MKEIIAQIKFDSQQIESKLKSIENTKKDMVKWIGKPIYQGCEEALLKWSNEIIEHKEMLIEYLDKLKMHE
tara:strand:+ start:654 stop:866 length:213 start_codon:yes stop_codon:yes gene_type:complete